MKLIINAMIAADAALNVIYSNKLNAEKEFFKGVRK
jgi:hypothetical protein